MDYRSLTKLLTKIGGLFVILYALNQLSMSFGIAYQFYNKQQDLLGAVLVGALPVLFPLLLGLALFIFPGAVSNRLLQAEKDPERHVIGSISRIEEAGLILVAVYILVHSIGDVAYWLSRVKLYYLIVESDKLSHAPSLLPEDFAQLFALAIQVIVAVGLFFGASGLVRLKNKLRGRSVE
jgi:hypothetical protein